MFRELFDGFGHLNRPGFELFDAIFVVLFDSRLPFGHSLVNAFVLLSKCLEFVLKLMNLELVFRDLVFVVLDLFGRGTALYQRLYFLFQLSAVLQVLFHSFLQLLVLLLVEVYIFDVVLD